MSVLTRISGRRVVLKFRARASLERYFGLLTDA